MKRRFQPDSGDLVIELRAQKKDSRFAGRGGEERGDSGGERITEQRFAAGLAGVLNRSLNQAFERRNGQARIFEGREECIEAFDELEREIGRGSGDDDGLFRRHG